MILVYTCMYILLIMLRLVVRHATLTFAEAVRIIDILLSRVWTCKTKSCSSLCGGVSTGFTALLHCDNYCIVGNFGEH